MIDIRLAQLKKKIADQRAHLDELEGHMYVPGTRDSLFVSQYMLSIRSLKY
jgi:hypothetical protein